MREREEEGGRGEGGDGGWRGPWTSSRAGPDDVCAQRRPRSTRLLCGRDSGRGRTWARQTQDSMHAAAEDRRSGHGIATEVASGSSHRALGRRCARVVVAGVGDGQVKLRSPPRQCPCMRRLAPPTRTTHGSARVAWVARPLAGGGREHCGRGDRDMRMSAQWRGPPRASSPRPSGSTPPRACSARLAARPPRGSPVPEGRRRGARATCAAKRQPRHMGRAPRAPLCSFLRRARTLAGT